MIETIPNRSAERAFLGAEANNQPWVKRIDKTAQDLVDNKVLNPTTAADKAAQESRAIYIVNTVGQKGEFKTDSVNGLQAVLTDPQKTERQKGIAEERLDILGKAVHVAMKYGPDQNLGKIIERGDVTEIEKALPNALKGLGERVRNNEITKPEIRAVLDKLDRKTRALKAVGKGGEAGLAKAISDAILELSDINYIDAKGDDEIMVVSAYLGSELRSTGVANGGDINEALLQKIDELGKAIENLKKEEKAEIPRDRESQLRMVRGMLERIESRQVTTRDFTSGQISAKLEDIANSNEVFPEVAREIRSRIKLHDCSVLMKKANGYIESKPVGQDPECQTVGAAATLAEGLNHALDTEAINFFLKEGANGLPVDLAWDIYQDINIDYLNVLRDVGLIDAQDLDEYRTLAKKKEDKKISDKEDKWITDFFKKYKLRTVVDNDPDMGTMMTNYLTDSDPTRKAAVDKYIISEISRIAKKDRSVAEKAWGMGKRLALATGENSVFFASLTGNDEMAEAMFLRQYREGRDDKGRPRGPQIHLNKIVGIGNSWLRRASGVEPYDNKGVIPLYSKDVVTLPTGDSSKPGIEEGSYVAHFSVWWSGKIHPLRGLLLQRDPDPQKICNIDAMQTYIDFFNKADPDGKKDLKFWWVTGVLDLASSYGNLGWTQDDISKFRQYLVDTKLSDKAGSFISNKDWAEIMLKGGFAQKMLKLDVKRTARNIISGATGGSGGRKR